MTGRAGCTVGVIVRVMRSNTGLFNVRPRVGAKAKLHHRRECENDLRDREENNSGSPQEAREHSGVRHEDHVPGEVYEVQEPRQPQCTTGLVRMPVVNVRKM